MVELKEILSRSRQPLTLAEMAEVLHDVAGIGIRKLEGQKVEVLIQPEGQGKKVQPKRVTGTVTEIGEDCFKFRPEGRGKHCYTIPLNSRVIAPIEEK